ncbi:hypothetical protein FOL47_002956 [Perkinsus chesapeaki]|uniref:Phospholipid/glycerol acyltransferase domain-containing protein n=1 Tax=Perkinsus chesapeaki TaxID=330153 RepID=A0A7J6MAX2_PERCH|nr:hypothetical protein FOL47_002956 [Perkinsus chesapeaki]
MDDNGVLMLFTHASNLDGFAVAACFNMFSKYQLPLGVVAKKSLFKIPIFGTLFRLTGVVALDRTKHTEAINSLDSAVVHIDSGYVVGISPEGTRRRTPSWGPDQLKPFKKGPFHMIRQIKSKTFMPVTLFGANAAWPPGCLFPIPGSKVTVRFGKPIKVDPSKDVTEIQSEAREVFKQEIVAGMANKPYSQELAFSLGKRMPRPLLWASTGLLYLPLLAICISSCGAGVVFAMVIGEKLVSYMFHGPRLILSRAIHERWEQFSRRDCKCVTIIIIFLERDPSSISGRRDVAPRSRMILGLRQRVTQDD